MTAPVQGGFRYPQRDDIKYATWKNDYKKWVIWEKKEHQDCTDMFIKIFKFEGVLDIKLYLCNLLKDACSAGDYMEPTVQATEIKKEGEVVAMRYKVKFIRTHIEWAEYLHCLKVAVPSPEFTCSWENNRSIIVTFPKKTPKAT